jgi:prepilin-type N-terminal cleavage/methylation domain-containing protein
MCRNCQKGFTLIELMVVIVIIGVLASIAIPKFTDASVKAKVSELSMNVSSWDKAMLMYLQETGTLARAVDDISFSLSPSKWFNYVMTDGGSDPAVLTVTSTTQMGRLPPNTNARSVVDPDGTVTHDRGTFDIKYLPHF